MKKNYFVLSLILMLFGINVSFAGVRVGQSITDPNSLKAGDKILLRAGRANNPDANPEETPFVYKWVASLADSMVWANSSVEGNIDISNLIDPYTSFSLEAAESQVNGKVAYYLKNDFNGKYLAYVYEETTENEDGELEGSVIPNDKGSLEAQLRLVYTADKSAAAPFAFVLASEGCNWNSEYTGEEQPSAENVMIYTTLKEYTEKEIFIAINQAYGTPWAANYGDWGGWFNIYTPDITDKYQSYPPDNQIYAYMEWEAELGEDIRHYDVFVVRSSLGSNDLWIYEDLTKAYKKQFPEANITKIVRALVGEIYK